ncbi:MAG: hypothetical protein IH850_03710 [Acidobacteria bacterium]|nr:hypothetical protein [Acidobacteriota bacterium]MCH8993229.1 hypothetical protein [Acidobacteriota bacterium]
MMKRTTPDIGNDKALEAWFAKAGVTAVAVNRCPVAACERCRRTFDRAA